MIRTILLALLLTSPAHAEGWCTGILTSNNVCESNLPPMIVRCDYYDSGRSDPRCLALVIDVLMSSDERLSFPNHHSTEDLIIRGAVEAD